MSGLLPAGMEEEAPDASLLMPLPVPSPPLRAPASSRADPVAAAMAVGLEEQQQHRGRPGSPSAASVAACPLSPPSLSLAFSNHPPTPTTTGGGHHIHFAAASPSGGPPYGGGGGGGMGGGGGGGDGFALSERAMSEFGDPDYQMFLQSLVNDGDDFLFADEEEDGDPTYDPKEERGEGGAAGGDGGGRRGGSSGSEGESDSERSSASSSSGGSGGSSSSSESDSEGEGSSDSSDEEEGGEDDYDAVRSTAESM